MSPAPSSSDVEAETGDSTRHLLAALARAGIDHLGLTPGFLRYLGSRPFSELLASAGEHHNADGDRVVAALVRDHLATRELVPTRLGTAPAPAYNLAPRCRS